MNRAGILMLLALAVLWPRTAFAADTADCKLKLVNTIPITMAHSGARALVDVKVNGTELKFLLDTGGYATQISAAAAQQLKLPITESGGKLLDLYGNATYNAAKVDAFAIGRLQDKNTILPLMTDSIAPKVTAEQEPLFVGLLAADYMGEYDIELDFAGGKMNYFSKDHCEGQVVYWPSAAIAAVPMRFVNHHLILDVMLDGKPQRAIIDTGAPGTTLSMAEARRVFGITADNNDKAFEHVFQKLSFEGLEVGNPHIKIIPDKIGSKDPNNGFATGTRTKKVDDLDSSEPTMLIGMNILSKLHLYIAFKERKIYITPASLPRPTPQ
jgi:hypothetical protein